MMKRTIWFWQRMVTPHIAHLAAALARRGHDVTYVAEEEMAADRVALGWQLPYLEGVALRFAASASDTAELVERAPANTVHLTQGLRSNGNIASAQAAIKGRGQRHFVIMETVDQRGLPGMLKPALYFWHLRRWRRGLDGILAIGATTPAWLRRLGPAQLHVYPFAYFLPEYSYLASPKVRSIFRFIFVGQFIPRKQVDLLLRALGSLSEREFEVELLGDGPLRGELEVLAERVLPGRVTFRGVLPIKDIPNRMAQSDCLVLPSSHDGWGAVVSEALMAGTPAICSDACGSAGVVHASGFGGVFRTNDRASLKALLDQVLRNGPLPWVDRVTLANWSTCLGSDAGADYLLNLLEHHEGFITCPPPPWELATKATN